MWVRTSTRRWIGRLPTPRGSHSGNPSNLQVLPMNSIPHYWASMLRTIYYLEDPRERAQALLNLKRPPVHDARYLQLVYSVERNAGHSGAVLARRAVKHLQ